MPGYVTKNAMTGSDDSEPKSVIPAGSGEYGAGAPKQSSDLASTTSEPPDTTARNGFHHSARRIVVEVAIAVAVVTALGATGIWAIGRFSAWSVRFVPKSVDVKIGDAVAAGAGFDRCKNDVAQAYVQDILDLLLTKQADTGFSFRISLASSTVPNAFAAPGGYIVVHRGLLTTARSGEEVAAVLAHEIQHVARRHSMKALLRAAGGSIVVGLILGWTELDTLIGAGMKLAGQAYSRDDERDADERGRHLLREVGISPAALAEFFARLSETRSFELPAILSTHPMDRERIERARADARGFTPTRSLPPPPKVIECE